MDRVKPSAEQFVDPRNEDFVAPRCELRLVHNEMMPRQRDVRKDAETRLTVECRLNIENGEGRMLGPPRSPSLGRLFWHWCFRTIRFLTFGLAQEHGEPTRARHEQLGRSCHLGLL